MVSLMNGLSALGAGVAQFAGSAGLELQKSQLAQQQAILADQLATTRETKLQGQQQQAEMGRTQATIAGTAANTATQEAGANTRNTATIAGNAANTAATNAAMMARTQAEISAPSPTYKLIQELTHMPRGAPQATPSAPSSTTDTPASPSTTDQSTSGGSTTSGAGATSGGTGGASGTTPALDTSLLIGHALGQPMPGSPEATRYNIAQDVAKDPNFKYKTAGQQSAEVENRVAVAEAKMTDPADREVLANAIAGYQKAPLDNFAVTRPGGLETMSRALQINPDYQESRYPEVSKAMGAFGSGKQGDTIRSLNVGVQHLDVIDQAAAALSNGNVNVINSLKNTFQTQFGAPAPTTFDGLKQIVGTEVEKAVAGGIGTGADRDRIMKALDGARSPAQLQAMTDGFRALMVGQLNGLKSQYEDTTPNTPAFRDGGPFAFENKLVPATVARLRGGGAAAPASPKLPAIGEVQQGYTYSGGDPANPNSWKPVQ